MKTMTLGRTGIVTNQIAFGVLPLQRVTKSEAVYMLQKARDAGITFYDTARGYTDSEEKIGAAFGSRDDLFIATKNSAQNGADMTKMLDTSLQMLKRDYVDIFQFHNPSFCPRPDDGTGLYEAALKAKEQGKIRHIGISQHHNKVAIEAIESGLYDSLQYPLSYLSDETDINVMKKCVEHGMGYIVMKAMAGGLLDNAQASYAFLDQYNVLPIWGIQHDHELDEFISFIDNPPAMTPDLHKVIERDRKDLASEFCRGCGYCLPCPVNIPINMAARMSLFLRRSTTKTWLNEENQEKMARIESCVNCGHCVKNCPYGLDVTGLLEKNYADYKGILSGEVAIKHTDN